jgi:hypothetical protein
MSSSEPLALELRREAEEIFRATGEVIVVAPTDESAGELIFVSQTRSLKVSHVGPDHSSATSVLMDRPPPENMAIAAISAGQGSGDHPLWILDV